MLLLFYVVAVIVVVVEAEAEAMAVVVDGAHLSVFCSFGFHVPALYTL